MIFRNSILLLLNLIKLTIQTSTLPESGVSNILIKRMWQSISLMIDSHFKFTGAIYLVIILVIVLVAALITLLILWRLRLKSYHYGKKNRKIFEKNAEDRWTVVAL
ncbi:hypothetical protein TUBRATIS_23300 [Tubulinosema ratisbonensis]|uniref:Uncharacterized protein n=1 Tax=Tubulinosema ratisbonensis TaxID=291195 RepID=A0A437AJK5_9MICR|nr:hypothetical protein TUBRATIS_23300 [Tubulinosema ratisbonensis]